MSNITREGIEVKVGQVWRDLDGRMNSRHCKVIAIDEGKGKGKAAMARCRPDGTLVSHFSTRVSISRMHKSSTGWALVEPAGESLQEAKE